MSCGLRYLVPRSEAERSEASTRASASYAAACKRLCGISCFSLRLMFLLFHPEGCGPAHCLVTASDWSPDPCPDVVSLCAVSRALNSFLDGLDPAQADGDPPCAREL